MKSRDSLPLIGLVVGGLVAVLVACGVPNNPLGPSTGGAAFGPSSTPYGPSSGPYGPSSRPYGPSSGPYGPSSRPTGPSSNPGGGGGVTPPTPVPTATPTPNPSATPPGGDDCPATFTARADDQVTISSNPQTVSITMSGFADDCIVTGIEVSVYITTATDFTNQPNLLVDLSHDLSSAVRVVQNPIQNLSGSGLGSSCANLKFADNGEDLAAGTPPYVGTFKPVGTFSFFDGQDANGLWKLTFRDRSEALTLECWRIDFDLDRATP